MLSPKKRDHVLARRQLYLNYGALSLATILDATGLKTLLFHGEHEQPSVALRMLIESGSLPSRFPVMVSIPSFYALPWASAFCQLLRTAFPSSKIIVGGRWVVGPDPEWLQKKLPAADLLVPGLGEPLIQRLVNGVDDVRRLSAPTPDQVLNHRLVFDHERYQPSVEASRGCGMGCAFCEERDIRLEKLRSPDQIACAIAAVSSQYNGGQIRPYLQSSMFLPSERWASALANSVSELGLNVHWRTETRVDALRPETIPYLAKAGMRVLDLGLETASPQQIVSMHKSSDPERYLRRASLLLRACRESGVATKVNVLLYAGETSKTLDETRTFLDEHIDSIAGVSVGPVVAYGPPKIADALLEEWAKSGATPVDSNSAAETGISQLHLSREIDQAEAESASLELSRRYMDASSYFQLKSFSYYARDYTRKDFDNDVRASPSSRLPFRTDMDLTRD